MAKMRFTARTIFICALSFYCNFSISQKKKQYEEFHGIYISLQQYQKLYDSFYIRMKGCEKFTVDECIILSRLNNSDLFNRKLPYTTYAQFVSLFTTNYKKYVIARLEAENFDYWFYSKKYNIYIGGRPMSSVYDNSMYVTTSKH